MNNLSEKALEDYQLVRKALDEDNQLAYSILMDRYRDSIYHTMLKMINNQDDAEDLTIEAFGKAFLKLNSYTPSYAFSTWLFKIATNNCIDFIRKKKMNTTSIDHSFNENGESFLSNIIREKAQNPEEKFILEQRKVVMREMLDKMNEKYRQMIEMRYYDELSYQEISEKMDLPVGTVKAQLFRAREQLMELFKTIKPKI
jgi:RNA polymerase sigma-70 factor (ECF subfamily)